MDMQRIKGAVVRFIKDEEGLTIVEYAVAGGLISLVVVTAFTDLGAAVRTRINALISALGGTPSATP